jgi:hypothetical protein
MRRVLALVSALVLVLTMGSAVSAKAPGKFEVHQTGMWCDYLEGSPGTVFFGVGLADDGSTDGYLELWSGEPFDGPPDLTRNYDEPVTGSIAGGTLTATIPLVTADGTPAGSATVDALLEAAGDPFAPESFREGNRWIKTSGLIQPLAVTGGTLTVDGGTFTLGPAACGGDRVDVAVFETNPTAFVSNFADQVSACTIEDGAGSTARLVLSVEGSDIWAWVWVEQAGVAAFFADGSGTLDSGSATIQLTVSDPDTGEPTGATGSMNLALTRNGERYGYTREAYNERFRSSGELLDVEGSLSFTTGESFSLNACVFYDGDAKRIVTNPQGPRPGGKAPSNDLPTNAATFRLGGQASANTRGAALDAEVPYECMQFVEEDGTVFDASAQHTVWYKVTGTGAALQVDTTGSDFDTVVAVYTADGAGGYVPVADACLDDTALVPAGFTWQTIFSFPTSAGTTYFVQAGGFPGPSNYGSLKLAIR